MAKITLEICGQGVACTLAILFLTFLTIVAIVAIFVTIKLPTIITI